MPVSAGPKDRFLARRDGVVSETPTVMRHFLVFHYPEEARLARPWAAELAREGKDEEDGFNGGRCV